MCSRLPRVSWNILSECNMTDLEYVSSVSQRRDLTELRRSERKTQRVAVKLEDKTDVSKLQATIPVKVDKREHVLEKGQSGNCSAAGLQLSVETSNQ